MPEFFPLYSEVLRCLFSKIKKKSEMRESSSNALTAAFCFLTKQKKIRNERERERDCSNALTTAFGFFLKKV